MSAETAALQAAPDLAGRVARRVRRRRGRVRLVALRAVVLVVAGAIPAYVSLTRPPVTSPPQHAAAPPKAVLPGGIEIRYLPADLTGPPRRTTDSMRKLPGTILRWSHGDRKVEIGVYTGDPAKLRASGDVMALNVLNDPITPPREYGPVVSGDGSEMMWIPRRGVIIDVVVSLAAKDELAKVAAGIDVPWDRSMGGITVGYTPPGLRPVETEPASSADGVARTWTGPGGARATIEVVYGMRALSLDALR